MRLKRVITTGLGVAALTAAAALPAWTAPAAGAAPTHGPSTSPFAPGSGQLVADWNKTLVTIQGMPGAQPATVHPTRSFAILSGAVYDSVVSITKVGRPYLFKVRVHGRASAAAAADQAAHDVLTALYPAAAETAVTNSQFRTELAKIPGGRARTEGRRVGAAVAAELLAIRSTDGSSLTPPTFVPGTAVGDYQPTPPAFSPPVFTIWGNVTPFVLRSGSQFRAPAPPAVTSAAYQKSLARTESLGQDTSTTRIPDWTASAKFWAASPVWNIWNQLAQSEVTSHSSSLEGASAMFSSLDFALADTAISLYDSKYHYQVWRPITAIRHGIGSVKANPNWNPLVTTAPDPSYPGAHAGFSFAAADVLSGFFGGDLPVTLNSDGEPGVTRSFPDFESAADDASLSRIWAGNHTSIDEDAGQSMGHQVGSFVLKHFDPFRASADRRG